MTPLPPLLLYVILTVCTDRTDSSRPSYIECVNSDDCGASACCVLGFNRFSTPYCKPLQEVGHLCRPGHDVPFNTTLTYPNNLTVTFINVYHLLCPCTEGLECGEDSVCEEEV